MSWEDVLKMPPIRNPRADKVPKNDNLTMDEYEKLFEKVADPEIEDAGKSSSRNYGMVSLDDLDMSKEKAVKVAKKLYADMGYLNIFTDGKMLFFELR